MGTTESNSPAVAPAPPVVCTLNERDLAVRRLEWTDLGPSRLTSRPTETGVVSTFPVEMFDDLKDLVERENDCCGTWLSSTIEREGAIVRVELSTSNPEGLALIRSMAGVPE